MSRRDLDNVANMLMQFARLMLSEQGDFYPFATGLTHDDEFTSVDGSTGDESPDPAEVVEVLFTALAKQASSGEIKAAGICTDVEITPPGGGEPMEAICVEIEDLDGEALEVLLPYEVSGPGSVSFGEIIVTPGEPRLFISSAH